MPAQPPAEVRVDADLVRRLLEEQVDWLAAGALSLVGEGWDNFTFRLGDDLAVRLPRRAAAVPLLLNEQRYLPHIARRVRLDVPEPVEAGVASEIFPWPWSVVRWISGAMAGDVPLSVVDAELLADDLRALHREAGPEAPTNPHRGVPLRERHDVVSERLRRFGLNALERVWMEALEAPLAERSVWIHGDLHPRNVIVSSGALTGLVDWGDITGGDAATDLACAWMLFDVEARQVLLEAYGASDAERVRARGWAVAFVSTLLDSEDADYVAIGRSLERRIV